jgi:dGTPase
VYEAPPLVEERTRSMAMIGALFEHFVKEPDRLPEPYAEQSRRLPPHRIVCDYIAAMTDGFVLKTVAALGLLAEPRL